jgi:hypothetical protein
MGLPSFLRWRKLTAPYIFAQFYGILPTIQNKAERYREEAQFPRE